MPAKKGQKFKEYTFETKGPYGFISKKVGHIVNLWRSSGLQIDIG
ncbi:hypothetical protein ABH892_000355 [Paenibacillus sp. RC254]|nr:MULTISPECIES: hypothetical protein [unclassified Paenibacillus]